MKKFLLSLLCVSVILSSAACFAAEYPSRAVTINTSRSGSQIDYIARAFAKTANKYFPKSVIVNSTSGQIDAYRETMRANPDGYSLGLVNNTVVINDVVGTTDFDALKVVEPLAIVGNADGSWIAIRKDTAEKGNIKTLSDLIEYTKQHPDELFITDRTASNTNTIVLQLEEAGLMASPADAGLQTERLTNFLSGNCDIFIGAYGSIQQYIERGDVVCLASCGVKRNKFSPEIPCTKELGYNIACPVVYYLFAPKGLPEDVKAKIMDLCKKVTSDPEFEADIANNTIEPAFEDEAGTMKFLSGMKADMIRLGMGEGYKD